MLVLTADHGCDPTTRGPDHTRQHAPLLASFAGHGGVRHDGPWPTSAPRCCAGCPVATPGGARRAVHAVTEAPAAASLMAAGVDFQRGCGGGSKPQAAGTPTPASPAAKRRSVRAIMKQLERLMDRRAAALGAGRVRAYAGTGTGPQRERDRAAARNARGLGLRDVALVVDSADVVGRRATLRVHSLYGVRGVRGSFGSARRVTALRTGAGWRVRGETSRRERHPWEVGPVQARRSRHFVVLAPAGLEVAALQAALEDGYARMGDVLLLPAAARPLPGRRRGRRPGGARADRERSAASSRWRRLSDAEVREEGRRAAGRRGRLAAPRGRVAAVQHARPRGPAARGDARAHARRAGRHGTSGRTPAWLVEGVALYVSEDRRIDQRRAAGGPEERPAVAASGLSGPDAIARLSGDRQSTAWASPPRRRSDLVERFGRRRFLRLFSAFNDEALPEAGRAPRCNR